MPLNHLLEGPIVPIIRGKAITEYNGPKWISPTISTMGIFLCKREMPLLVVEEDTRGHIPPPESPWRMLIKLWLMRPVTWR